MTWSQEVEYNKLLAKAARNALSLNEKLRLENLSKLSVEEKSIPTYWDIDKLKEMRGGKDERLHKI